MTRGGRTKVRDVAERRCIVTAESRPQDALVRFVVDPDGRIVPDILGRLPGRGIWVSASRRAIETAVAKRLFARAARQAVEVPDGLGDSVERQLAQRVIELISLARKAGQAVAGYEKVRDWLVRGDAAVLVQASDGSPRGKSKLAPPDGTNTFIGVLSASELGLAFGREHVIHGALAAGGLTVRVVGEAARLSGLREYDGGTAVGKDTKTI